MRSLESGSGPFPMHGSAPFEFHIYNTICGGWAWTVKSARSVLSHTPTLYVGSKGSAARHTHRVSAAPKEEVLAIVTTAHHCGHFEQRMLDCWDR